MKVLIDAVHPADVWTLGAVEDRLLAAGEETLWLSRPGKDSVVELIEALDRKRFGDAQLHAAECVQRAADGFQMFFDDAECIPKFRQRVEDHMDDLVAVMGDRAR